MPLRGAAENPLRKVWSTPLPTTKGKNKREKNCQAYVMPLCMWKLSRSEFGTTCQLLPRDTQGKLLPSFLFTFKRVSSLSTDHRNDTWEFAIEFLLSFFWAYWYHTVEYRYAILPWGWSGRVAPCCSTGQPHSHRHSAFARGQLLMGSICPTPRQLACTGVSASVCMKMCWYWCRTSATPRSRKSRFNN